MTDTYLRALRALDRAHYETNMAQRTILKIRALDGAQTTPAENELRHLAVLSIRASVPLKSTRIPKLHTDDLIKLSKKLSF